MFKKAQAAMEFLMTYGWAILVVLVVIGALAYFGVLSPSTLLPEKCTFPSSVSCIDHSIQSSSVTIVLQNGAGRDMSVTSVDTVSEALGGATGDGNTNNQCKNGTGFVLRNGASTKIALNKPVGTNACDFRETGRDKNRYAINVTYSWLDSQSINHSLSGELLARKP